MLKGDSISQFLGVALFLALLMPFARAAEPLPVKAPVDTLTHEEIKKALQAALATGCKAAVATLGKEDGFYKDSAVKITLPEDLDTTGKAGRGLGRAMDSDRFVQLMNRAAEMAVPGAKELLAEAVAGLILENAREILQGPADAATDYFKRTCRDSLEKRILPLVKEAALDVGTAAAYRPMTKRAGPDAKPAPAGRFDLNAHITRRVMDALFLKIAAEEKRIRADPAAQSSEILKKVFGAAATKRD